MVKKVKGYSNYYVSDKGEFITVGDGKIRVGNGVKHLDGMYRVLLADDEGWEVRKLHELVAESFCYNPNNFSEVKHIDNDYNNNRADNLLYISDEEYDKLRYAKDGKILYEIEGYPLYFIEEETHTIYSDKLMEMYELTISEAESYSLTDLDGKPKRMHKDLWWERRKKDFSKSEYSKLKAKYGELYDQTRKIVNLVTGEVYKDKDYAAADSPTMSARTIAQHCNGTVRYPLYCWEDEWDGNRLYDAKIRDLSTNKVYDTLAEAAENCGDTEYTIWNHCNGKIKNDVNLKYEYASEILSNTEKYKGHK